MAQPRCNPLSPTPLPPAGEGHIVFRKPSKSATGFTLLELLVALAVFSVMAVAAYAGLKSVLDTQAAVEQEAERLKRVQMALWRLEQDLEQAVGRSVRDEFGQPHPALESGGRGGELIAFTRAGWDNPLQQQRASLQRLAYRLDEESRLIRMHWNTLDRGGISEPRETALLDRVQELRLRFLGSQTDWQAEWPPSDAGADAVALPRAVEVTVVLADWGEIVRLFRLPETQAPDSSP